MGFKWFLAKLDVIQDRIWIGNQQGIGSGLPPFSIKYINFHKICNIKSSKLFNIGNSHVRERQRALGSWQFYGKENFFFSFYHCCNIKQGLHYFLRSQKTVTQKRSFWEISLKWILAVYCAQSFCKVWKNT